MSRDWPNLEPYETATTENISERPETRESSKLVLPNQRLDFTRESIKSFEAISEMLTFSRIKTEKKTKKIDGKICLIEKWVSVAFSEQIV